MQWIMHLQYGTKAHLLTWLLHDAVKFHNNTVNFLQNNHNKFPHVPSWWAISYFCEFKMSSLFWFHCCNATTMVSQEHHRKIRTPLCEGNPLTKCQWCGNCFYMSLYHNAKCKLVICYETELCWRVMQCLMWKFLRNCYHKRDTVYISAPPSNITIRS